MGDDPRRHREPECLRLPVELAEQHSGLSTPGASFGIDADAAHRSEVDHDPSVGDREPGEAVAPAPDGDLETGPAREPHGRQDVGDAGAVSDQRWGAVDRAVPDPAIVIVGGALGADERPPERRLELAKRRFVQPNIGGRRHRVGSLPEAPGPSKRASNH